jgi:hypothetical protein
VLHLDIILLSILATENNTGYFSDMEPGVTMEILELKLPPNKIEVMCVMDTEDNTIANKNVLIANSKNK